MSEGYKARKMGGYMDMAAKLDTGPTCVFCQLKDKYIIAERDGLVLTANIFPYIDGQLMVVPRRHVERFSQVTEQEVMTNFYLSQLALTVLREEMGIENVWMILRDGKSAGKTVTHLHWNILPYEEGLNTWNYRDITVPPVELATRLRQRVGKL